MNERVQSTLPIFQEMTSTRSCSCRIHKCYGCGEFVRHTTSDNPPSPWDTVLGRKELRVLTPRGSISERISRTKENVYYHRAKACVLKKNKTIGSGDIVIPPEVHCLLNDLHKQKLAVSAITANNGVILNHLFEKNRKHLVMFNIRSK